MNGGEIPHAAGTANKLMSAFLSYKPGLARESFVRDFGNGVSRGCLGLRPLTPAEEELTKDAVSQAMAFTAS